MAVDNVKLPFITDPADTFQREVRNALLLLERRLKTVEGEVTVLEDAPAGTGEANTASNVGSGSQVFQAKTGVDLAFRSILGSASVTVTQNANDITLTAAASGEANTASNLGSGSGLFASKSGVDLRFKSLVAGTNVALTAGANDVTITSTFTGFGAVFLGDGSDGALVFNGVAAVLGVSPVAGTSPDVGSNTYTMTRDIFATSIAISSAVVLRPNGYRVWCTGAITGPGHISRAGVHGVAGANATVAANGAGGTAGGAQSPALLGRSGAGGNGGAGGNPPTAGVAASASASCVYGVTSGTATGGAIGGNAGTAGGVGRGGGSGSTSLVGASGGTTTLIASTDGPYVGTLPQNLTGRSISNAQFTGGSGGAGGPGGLRTAGPGFSGGGGGGGGGAGPLVVNARSFSGGVTLTCAGGNGGNGGNSFGAGTVGGGAGGGGGGGSWACVGYAEGTAPTVTVTASTGGTGGTSTGTFAGGNGGTGGAGLAYIFNLGA